jgi:orotidine-5'-phosphate decarboxylase
MNRHPDHPRERILVALDTPEHDRAIELARLLAGHVGGFKVGLELFGRCGPSVVDEIRSAGVSVFLDLKLHDIPNTVAGAAAAAGSLGVNLLTVHALGGIEMIRRAVESSEAAAGHSGHLPPTVLVVTVLTSHDDALLERIGLSGPCSDAVARLTSLARDAGAGGVVCSPLEVARARELFPDGLRVVPGVRPAGRKVGGDDQARTATPAEAVARGADRLVIGRPITAAADPVAAAAAIAAELEGVAGP